MCGTGLIHVWDITLLAVPKFWRRHYSFKTLAYSLYIYIEFVTCRWDRHYSFKTLAPPDAWLHLLHSHVAHSYVGPRLLHSHVAHSYVGPRIHQTLDMTHSKLVLRHTTSLRLLHSSFIYGSWLIHMWRDSLECMTLLFHMWDMTRSTVTCLLHGDSQRYTVNCISTANSMWIWAFSYVGRDSFNCEVTPSWNTVNLCVHSESYIYCIF